MGTENQQFISIIISSCPHNINYVKYVLNIAIIAAVVHMLLVICLIVYFSTIHVNLDRINKTLSPHNIVALTIKSMKRVSMCGAFVISNS